MTDEDTSPQEQLQVTDDGSHTLYSGRFGQQYHNPNGAVAESRHNFFDKNGLLPQLATVERITILEIGFGTGLNFLLLLDKYMKTESSATIHYYSIEGFPIAPETAASFNYEQYLDHPELIERLVETFNNLTPGMNRYEPAPGFTLHLFYGMFEEFSPDEELQADFIFHDPFSPRVNEELWTGAVFKKLAVWSSPDAVLTTYSAASKARGAMAWAGWHAAREEGALGKREMTVASLNPAKLSHLERVNEERLAHRYETDDF